MSYEVLARKWRPGQFDDVVGQEHVTRTLKNAIKTGRIAHAYLFVGPRGIGKTSVARIFAKALNCVEGPTVTPCDKCDSCKEISSGSSLDVLEIDGASNNGVDQVRDLRDTVKYAPVRAPYKIYVIDEVHMLSVAAFNALLKTLEEPPGHVKFIFATTEPEKILATILSRCQRFDLRRIPVGLIIERLKMIAEDEKLEVDDDALLAIARGSEGGLRDAESALDQLISFKGTKIVEEDVLSVFGLIARSALEELAGMMLAGDIKSIINKITALDGAGKDLQRLVVELIGHFRNLLICLHVDDLAGDSDVTDAQLQVLKEQAKKTNAGRVIRITDILSDAEDKMRYALSVRTVLEMAMIRCARAATVVTLEEILAQVNELKKNLKSDSQRANDVPYVAAPPEIDVAENKDEAVTGNLASVREVEPGNGLPQDEAGELAILVQGWPGIIDKIAKIAIGTRQFLIDAMPVSVENGRVIIGFDPEFAGEAKNLEIPRNRRAVQHVLSAELKKDVSVSFEPHSFRESGQSGDDKFTVATEDEFESNEEYAKAGMEQNVDKKQHSDWIKEPEIQQVMELFGGSIVEVRQLKGD